MRTILKPLSKFLKNIFAKKRIIGEDTQLQGLLKADALLNSLINEKKVPGLAITVLRESKPILQKGYGYADIENKTPISTAKTIFRIASVSKPIAATALAHMVNEGLIDLEASFYKYVPYFPKKKWDFTIRQLASHTAGIRGYQGVEYALNKPFSIKEGIEIFKNDDLLFEPGTDYLYNSFDWVLISLAMQEVSGVPFEKYVKEKVLNSMRMTNTFTPNVERSNGGDTILVEHESSISIPFELMERKANFYSKNRMGFRKAIPVNNFYKLAGGGYLSTADDIAKLGQAYLEGKVLNREVLFPFLNSQIINGNKTYYGLGWQVSKDQYGRLYYGHVGNGVGGYSNFYIYPNEKLVIVILVNCTNPEVQSELNQVLGLLI